MQSKAKNPNPRENWTAGEIVRVGFLTLRVIARIPTPGNHSPDEFAMENLAGSKFYTFCPHRGIYSAANREAALQPNF